MTSADRSTTATLPASRSEPIERLEDGLLSRRSFLVGLALGGIGGAGAALGVARSDARFQSLATLAGGAAFPADTRYYLPAVDSLGAGVMITVDLAFEEGTGGLFVNLDGVEVSHDLQLALREAAATATRLTGRSLEGTKAQVTFGTPGTTVFGLRGKSWEAGLTVALVAALRQRALSPDVLVTGVVDRAGRLLPVGGIVEKAEVASAFGATELIVPPEQATGIQVDGLRVVSLALIADVLGRVIES